MVKTTISIRALIFGTWILYALTFLPLHFPKYLWFQWTFLGCCIFGIFLTLVSLLRARLVIFCTIGSAAPLLVCYFAYWVWVFITAYTLAPNNGAENVVFTTIDIFLKLIAYRYADSGMYQAAKIVYFDIAMPIVQLLIIYWIRRKQQEQLGTPIIRPVSSE